MTYPVVGKLDQGTWLMPHPTARTLGGKGLLLTDLVTKALLGQSCGRGNYKHGPKYIQSAIFWAEISIRAIFATSVGLA